VLTDLARRPWHKVVRVAAVRDDKSRSSDLHELRIRARRVMRHVPCDRMAIAVGLSETADYVTGFAPGRLLAPVALGAN
jgi:hypothetical protein